MITLKCSSPLTDERVGRIRNRDVNTLCRDAFGSWFGDLCVDAGIDVGFVIDVFDDSIDVEICLKRLLKSR